MSNIKKKMLNCAGESIAETLVALLISSLALMMLAGAVTAGTRVITRSNDVIYEYYDGDKTLAERSSGTNSTMILKEVVESGIEGESESGTKIASYPVKYFVNKFGSTAVVAYNVNLPATS